MLLLTLSILPEAFLIYQNDLTGPIPPEIGNLDLRRLQVYENRLNSSIPDGLWNNADLIDLRLDSNLLTGPISSRLGDLVGLMDLRLAFNELTGFLPNEFVRLSNLRTCITVSYQLCWSMCGLS